MAFFISTATKRFADLDDQFHDVEKDYEVMTLVNGHPHDVNDHGQRGHPHHLQGGRIILGLVAGVLSSIEMPRTTGLDNCNTVGRRKRYRVGLSMV